MAALAISQALTSLRRNAVAQMLAQKARGLPVFAFDRAFGIESRGIGNMAPHQPGLSRHQDGTYYEGTTPAQFRLVLRAAGVQPERYGIVDLGCGKGRVLFLAARAGFKSILGVEIDTELLKIARRNVQVAKRIDSSRIRLVDADAATWTPPRDQPLVVYLFNPFGPDTLQDLMNHLVESFEAEPRHIVVIYGHPLHESTVQQARHFHHRATVGGPQLYRQFVLYETPRR